MQSIFGWLIGLIMLGVQTCAPSLAGSEMAVEAEPEVYALEEDIEYYDDDVAVPPPPPPVEEEIMEDLPYDEEIVEMEEEVIMEDMDDYEIPEQPSEPQILSIVEQMPRFNSSTCEAMSDEAARKQCAMNAMMQYLGSKIAYPEADAKAGIEGTAYVQFVVEKDGAITNATLLRAPSGGLGREALRVVNDMPAWVPGRQRGKPVRVRFSLPIKFALTQ